MMELRGLPRGAFAVFCVIAVAGCFQDFRGSVDTEEEGSHGSPLDILVDRDNAYSIELSGNGWGLVDFHVSQPERLVLAIIYGDGQSAEAAFAAWQEAPNGSGVVMLVGHDANQALESGFAVIKTATGGTQRWHSSPFPYRIDTPVEPGHPLRVWLLVQDVQVRLVALIDMGPGIREGNNHYPVLEMSDDPACSLMTVEPPPSSAPGSRTWQADFLPGMAGALYWIESRDAIGTWSVSFSTTNTRPPETFEEMDIIGRYPSKDAYKGWADAEASARFTVGSTSLEPLPAGLAVWSLTESC